MASYFPPASFGPARARGTFNVPFTPDGASAEEQEARLRSNSFFEIPGVTAHEAYPGHHLHFAASQGTNALRQVLHSTYMVEGWGLYVENMMGEHGFYTDARGELGQLSMRLFRAGRIVVDTSLHLGEMSIDEATDVHGGALRVPGADGPPRGAPLLLVSHPGLGLPHRRPGDRAHGPAWTDAGEGDPWPTSTTP